MKTARPHIKWNRRDTNVQDLVDGLGEDVFLDILANLFQGRQEVAIEPLSQGRSGASVFRVKAITVEGSLESDRVVKIGATESLQTEKSNYEKHVKGVIKDYPVLDPAYLPKTGYGAIAYTFVGLFDSQTFTTCFLNAQTARDEIHPPLLVRRLFTETLSGWFQGQTSTFLKLTGELGFAISSSMLERFAKAVKELPALPRGLQIDINRVRAFWDSLEGLPLLHTFVCPVHGDLHSDNVLTNERGQLFLIDFAHTKSRHFLNDLTKFEASLRFRLIQPTGLLLEDAWAEWIRFEGALIAPGSYGAPDRSACSFEPLRLGYECIRTLRQAATGLMRNKDRSPEYFVGLLKHAIPMMLYSDPEIELEHRWRIIHTVFHLIDRLQRTPVSLSGKASFSHYVPELTRTPGNIPVPSYERLFGVEAKVSLVRDCINDSVGPTVIAIEGMGGVGKTAIATAAARLISEQDSFDGIAWDSVRQHEFDVSERWNHGPVPLHKLEAIITSLAQQLGFSTSELRSSTIPLAEFLSRFSDGKFLAVIDNFETNEEVAAIIAPLVNSNVDFGESKVLVTSRSTLRDYPHSKVVPVEELSKEISIALLRYEASRLSVAAVLTADDDSLGRIFDTVGGNPLALKLVLGQLTHLPLDVVIDSLVHARTHKVSELYKFIYRNSWNLLSERAQELLMIMPQFSITGADWQSLAALSELGTEALSIALKELTDMSLVVVGGTLNSRTYGIHRLTRTFLVEEILRWKTQT